MLSNKTKQTNILCNFFSAMDAIRVANRGFISFNIAGLNATRTENDLITMRFRTTRQNGVLFYADGNQGDFLALELRRGYVYLRIDLGESIFIQ